MPNVKKQKNSSPLPLESAGHIHPEAPDFYLQFEGQWSNIPQKITAVRPRRCPEMPNLNNTNNSNGNFHRDGTSSVALVWIYSLTLIGGIVGIIFMSFILSRQKDKLSITNISIINLVVVHGTFLLTVPFRIHYFATKRWTSSFYFCKLISIVIHTHLYLSFFFYLAILVVRFLPVIGRKPMGFNRPLIAFLASAAVWLFFFLSIFPLLWIQYGKDKKNMNDGKCFTFQSDIKDYVITVNIILAVVIIATSCAALVILLLVLMKIARSNHGNLFSHQEFRAQINNIRFIAIMFICFLPYHSFRIYYVLHLNNDESLPNKNEVYLAITSLCCWDLLTFVIIKR